MIGRLKRLAHTTTAMRVMDRTEAIIPGLRAWHRAQYRRHFEKFYQWERMFSGVYGSFAEARAAIPAGRPVGYDNEETATFLGQTSAMLPSEYPVLFWLSSLLEREHAVFDFGGYLGLNYNWYKPYGLYPDQLTWTIFDVPAVVRAGRAILASKPDPRLSFTDDFAAAAAAGVFIACGALQFCEEPLAPRLAALPRRPAHLLLNKLPLTSRESYFTLQNMGPAIAPYKVERRTDFVASLEALGYELVDTWKNPELGCFIPFHPEASIDAFDGMYFRAASLGEL